MVKILTKNGVLNEVSLKVFDMLLHDFKLKYNNKLKVWELV